MTDELDKFNWEEADVELLSVCFNCKHKYSTLPGCRAFPDGIPGAILEGSDKHEIPWPNQKNDLIFEPIE